MRNRTRIKMVSNDRVLKRLEEIYSNLKLFRSKVIRSDFFSIFLGLDRLVVLTTLNYDNFQQLVLDNFECREGEIYTW